MSEKKDDSSVNFPSFVMPPDVKKAGVLRKLKSSKEITFQAMKKKYFVLRIESEAGPARLEYYDSEKKFKTGNAAKRSISIKTCFNISRKVDAKHKYALALYTKDDCFAIVPDNESSRDDWLNAMLELQLDDPCMNGGAKAKPKFEHVWQVQIADKSLASARNMKGTYRVCLTQTVINLIKVDQTENPETLEFPLMAIRRCGHTHCFFVIEMGRSAVTGAGELWLETEDTVIAQNMHEVTLNAMKSVKEHEELCPMIRPRSASNSENSRPIVTRRPVAIVSPQTVTQPSSGRDRCDSMPSRSRTISEGQDRGYAPSSYVLDTLRGQGSHSRTISNSPPGIPNLMSPMSTTCSTDSAGSSLSIDEFDAGQQTDFAHGRYIHTHPTDSAIHTEPPIKEEQLDEYVPMTVGSDNVDSYMSMAPMSSSVPTRQGIYLHLNSTETFHTSSLPPIPQSSDYMEMKSPTEGYINMSPLGASSELPHNRSFSSMETSSDLTHGSDGYMPMAPIRDHSSKSVSVGSSQNEGYLDMAPLSSSLPKTFSVAASPSIGMSSRKDSISILSESPSSPSSTNLEDFPLDKVKSLLADTDDDNFEVSIRPVRAYSMGSRPQPKKPHLAVQTDENRTRAYSVGSQAVNKRSAPVDKEVSKLVRKHSRSGGSSPCSLHLPVKIRTSKRRETDDDLMEIDYNRVKYPTTSSIDFLDSNFTIEPVGRSRSGSNSSTGNPIKLLYDRDKGRSFSTHKDAAQTSSDYLSMSPISDHTRYISKSPNDSPVSLTSKKVEPLYPAGDYVSLDPTCIYQKLATIGPVAPKDTGSFKNYQQPSRSSSSRIGVTSPTSANACSLIRNNEVKKTIPAEKDGYMCMSYSQVTKSEANGRKSFPPLQQVKESSLPSSPTSKSPQGSSTPNRVPGTPPPSPCYGAMSSMSSLQCTPLMENVVRRLSQPFNNNNTSRPTSISGEVRLNYASLDLPPSSDEGNMGVLKIRNRSMESKEIESKEAPLTYAQIDFSPVKQQKSSSSLQDSDTLSHL